MKKIFILLCCLYVSTRSQAQLFTVTESSANPPIQLNPGVNGIVDINSRLTLNLNTTKLTERLAHLNKVNPATTDQLSQLIFILQNQQDILKQLQPYIPGTAVNRDQLQRLSALMSAFLQKVLQHPVISKVVDSIYRDAFRNGYDTLTYTTTDAYVISRLSVYCDQLAAGLHQVQGLGNMRIQLIALLSTKSESDRKIHIENFDDFKEGAYYEVPRWVTTFSDNDIAAFHQAGNLSKGLNDLLSANYTALVKQIPDSLDAYTCFSGLLMDIQNRLNRSVQSTQTQVNNYLDGIKRQLLQLNGSMQQWQQQKGTDITALQGFNGLSVSLLGMIQQVPHTSDSLFNRLADSTKIQVQQIHTELNTCLATLKRDSALIQNIYATTVAFLSPFKHSATAAANASGNAFSLALNQLPPEGFINLKTTGRRENGDELLIKIRMQAAADSSSGKWQTLEQQSVELQQIAFYSETNIGVILASPMGSHPAVKLSSTFQFAPAGSLLLKFGSRKSRFFNTLNPGIGFHISTPDFDLDGYPDVSYGGVLTLFRNVLSTGIAYNTRTSSPFWFFGLALPFTTLGLPFGGNVQSQKLN